MSPASPQYQVRALERALDVLDAFTIGEPELSFTELTARTGLSKGTAVRLLAVLERRGFLERSNETERYRIGVRAFEVGSIYIQTLALEREAHRYLDALVEECHQTANLGMLDHGEIVHLLVVPSRRPIHYSVQSGQRDDAHCTGLGKALLAGLSASELDALIADRGLPRHTERTITTTDELRAELATVRARGYAIDEEESVPGLTCIAAPIYDDRGSAAGAVSVSGQSSEFAEPNRTAYANAVLRTANEISRRLGAAVHDEPPADAIRAEAAGVGRQ
ncbi:MAG: IclR family transcriptional regulator [Thermomicrobiales bacterium]|nr:IclR family transcriptional regulator [Thermomicrobiales bacterium]